MNKLCLTTVIIILLALGAAAQKKPQKPVKTPPRANAKSVEAPHAAPLNDPAQDEKKVRDMISFLGFALNTLGNSNTSARDKDVLVTESYSKIFRDAKVQVEDDLDEERDVITNKDVVAYLKDINFFFKDVKFEFTIDKIDKGVNADNQTFYKVSLTRNLSGTTSEGQPVNNNTPRFIEINFNPTDQDLKIVSIYTHEFKEKEALVIWWKQLSMEWQSVFRKKTHPSDSVTLGDIRKIRSVEELDLGNNSYIQSFEPLSELKSLKVLNLTNTAIADLTPIRNLTDLVELNLSHTKITDLSPLRYADKLLKLNINNTKVSDITILQRMLKLQFLDLSATPITDFDPVKNLAELIALNVRATQFSDLSPVAAANLLTELNISRTTVKDVGAIKNLKNLTTLICDSTGIQDIRALSGLDHLRMFQANSTLLSDLQPLQGLAHLEKIYCDQTPIKKNAAEAFMASHPTTLVIYDSHDLQAWWDLLSPEWKHVISKAAKISRNPLKEELARVGNIDSINVSGIGRIIDLEPLRMLGKIRVLVASRTSIRDLSPIKDHREIKYLDVTETQVTDLAAVSAFGKLKVLKADRCKIGIDPLQKMKGLEKLYVDESGVNDINTREFLDANPSCLLIYKTVHLKRWWKNLPAHWKEIFVAQVPDSSRESLHRLVELDAFQFKDSPVTDLSGLSEFMRLKELHFSGTMMTTIPLLENLKSLKSLHASHSPIQKIESLGQLSELEDLDISNTPIDDLTPVWTLRNLKKLDCSGTQIKRLDALEKLEGLEYLDCSNTNVSKLVPLDYLHLKTLKCYNTRISERNIQNFIASHAGCKVIYYR